jgi:ABC-type uncharacterized transport system auxiliary subunit
LRVSRKRSLRVFCLAAMADLLCGCLKLNQPEVRQFLSLKRCEAIRVGSLANDGTDRRQ